MTSDEQPTRPLTDAELVAIHDAYTKSQKVVSGIVGDPTGPYAKDCGGNAIRHVGHLLAEVDRLRAEIDALSSRIDVTAVINETIGELADERNKLRARIDRLSAENSAHIGVNMACNAKIDRLQSERDALVRKLGLDWGSDEFGDLDTVPTVDSADRSEMLNDLQWYITDMGLEHWQNCPMDDEDCYLCAGHVAIRDRWKGVE